MTVLMHALFLLKAAKVVIMSVTKPIAMASWAVFGLALLVVAAEWWRRPRVAWRPGISTGLVITAAAILLVRYSLTGSGTLIAIALGSVLVFVIPRARGRGDRTLTQAVWLPAAVITLVISLAWWAIAPGWPDGTRVAAFVAILLLVYAGLRDRSTSMNGRPLITAIYLAAGGLVLLNVAPLADDRTSLTLLVHHWGAYIGPAQQILGGLVPFYDIPMQYGLGPTGLLVGACRVAGCWQGLHLLIIVTSLTAAWLLLQMALATSRPRGTTWYATVAAVAFGAMFLWPGVAAHGSGQVVMPSMTGLRTLPVLLVAWCLFFDRPRWACVALAVSISWSPEVAVWSLAVFVMHETMRLGFVRAVQRGVFVLGATSLSLVGGYRWTYGLWPQGNVIVEYILHVPGQTAVDPSGPFLLLVAVFGLGAWLVLSPPADARPRRRDLVAVSLLFTTTSYFLGRGDPNNIDMLMPFVVLVACRALDRSRDLHAPAVAGAVRLGLAASVATLALSSWRITPFGHGFDPGMATSVRLMPAIDVDMQAIRAGIVNPDHLGIADFGFGPFANRAVDETVVWTAMDPGSLVKFMPSERRRVYICRSATRLHRSGFAIFAQSELPLLEDFRVAYDVTESSTYQGATITADGSRAMYAIVKLVPR